MAGTAFNIYTRFNSGNGSAIAGSTTVNPPSIGNNPQDIDALVDKATYQPLNPGYDSANDQCLVQGLSKNWCLLGAQKLPSTTTTSDNVLIAATTINVNNATNIDNGTVIKIDNEEMLVTAVSGTALTVTRAYNGTTAAAHDGSGTPKAITSVPNNVNGGGFGLAASLITAGTVAGFTVVIKFIKTGNVTIKSYTLTEANSAIARDAITLSDDFGLPTNGDKLTQIDITPDPNGAIVEISGVLNWNS